MTTSTATAPAAFTGVTAVIDVALFTVKLVALVLPKRTAVAPVKSVPVMVTVVPPAVGPLFGLTPEIVGTGWNVNASFNPLVPNALVTDTVAGPATVAGVVTTIRVEVFDTMVPRTPSNSTDVALPIPVPVMVTLVPPLVGPEVGDTEATDGPAT